MKYGRKSYSRFLLNFWPTEFMIKTMLTKICLYFRKKIEKREVLVWTRRIQLRKHAEKFCRKFEHDKKNF